MLESVFHKVAGLQLSCEHCEIFKNRFFQKTPTVATSVKLINFPGKYKCRKRNRFIFLRNMTE